VERKLRGREEERERKREPRLWHRSRTWGKERLLDSYNFDCTAGRQDSHV